MCPTQWAFRGRVRWDSLSLLPAVQSATCKEKEGREGGRPRSLVKGAAQKAPLPLSISDGWDMHSVLQTYLLLILQHSAFNIREQESIFCLGYCCPSLSIKIDLIRKGF